MFVLSSKEYKDLPDHLEAENLFCWKNPVCYFLTLFFSIMARALDSFLILTFSVKSKFITNFTTMVMAV